MRVIEGQSTERARSLPLNFSWTLAGNITYALCQWGVLTVIARYGTPEMVGQFALALAITTPIILFFNLQLSGAQATDAREEFAFEDYLGLRLSTTVAALLVIVVIALALQYPSTTLWVIVAVGCAKATDAISDVYAGRLQQREHMSWIGIAQILNGLLTLGGVAAVFSLGGGLVLSMWASCLASLVTWLFYHRRVAPGMVPRARWVHSRRHGGVRRRDLLRASLPLGLSALAVSLYNNAPRYFIQHYGGDRSLGYFAAIWCFMTAGTTVMGALGQSAAPRLARYWLEGSTRAFRALLLTLVAIALGLGAAGLLVSVALGPQILSVVYRPDYAAHADLLVWVMAMAVLAYLSTAIGYAVTSTREFRRLTVPYWLAAAVGTGACLVLVPPYGLLGAAWAAGITYLAASVVPLALLLGLAKSHAKRGLITVPAYEHASIAETRV